MTINTSSGWDFIDDENIYGWSMKLSSIWTAVKPTSNQMELVKKSLKINASILFVADNIIIKKILIKGPKYWMIFNMAQIKAMAKEFSTPNINKSIK